MLPRFLTLYPSLGFQQPQTLKILFLIPPRIAKTWLGLCDIIVAGMTQGRCGQMKYGYKRQVNISYSDAVTKVKSELQKEGFGVLTEIDVKATIKKKLNVDYDNYIIIGACNPPFAYQALQAEKDIGLLLPCNVIVYDDGGKTFAASILPTQAMNMIENKKLNDIAVQVESKLKKVIDNI